MRGEPLLGNPNCGGIHKTETDAMANPDRETNEEEVRFQGEEGDRVASDEDEAAKAVVTTLCEKKHQWSDLLPRVAQVLFNVIAKNFIATACDAARAEAKSKSKRKSEGKTPQERKTAKLQSETV